VSTHDIETSAALVGLAILFSLVVIGLPAVFLKVAAGYTFACRRAIGRSIGFGVMVGIAIVAVNFAVLPFVRDFAHSLGGLLYTAMGIGLLAAAAIAVDYLLALRPTHSQVTYVRAIGFLALSNIWIVGGSYLIVAFNTITLFPNCWDQSTQQLVGTIYHPAPPGCRSSD